MSGKGDKTMGAGDRLLFFGIAVVLISEAITIMLLGLNLQPVMIALSGFSGRFVYGRWEGALISVVLILAGARLFKLSINSRKQQGALITRSDLGDVTITLPAIENLVKSSARQVVGVQEVKPVVHAHKDGLKINMKAWVDKDSNVPEIAAKVQETLKLRLSETAGLEAAIINVEVQDVELEQTLKPRPYR